MGHHKKGYAFFGNLLQPDHVNNRGFCKLAIEGTFSTLYAILNTYADKISVQIEAKSTVTDEGSYNSDQLETLRSCLPGAGP